MLPIYDATIPPLKRALGNLAAILKKAEEYADAKKVDHQVLLNSRLFVDMYPLTRQVQIATDMSKGAGARLAAIEIPKYEDNETSFAELQARIANTITFLDSINPEQLQDADTRDITITIRKADIKFSGQDYLLKWVLPNVYFHVTTAYNILRHNGVSLEKQDFLGPRD